MAVQQRGAAAAVADNVPASEVVSVPVDATGGTLTYTFGGETTSALAFDATSTTTVEAAMEGLSSIGAGNIDVTGGPGDSGGTTPYTFTFKGALAETDVGAITTGVGSLTGGAGTATPSVTTAGDTGDEVVSAEAGVLYGYSFRETASSTAVVILRDGASTSGTIIAIIDLAADEAKTFSFGDGVRYATGLFLERESGAVEGSCWILN